MYIHFMFDYLYYLMLYAVFYWFIVDVIMKRFFFTVDYDRSLELKHIFKHVCHDTYFFVLND